MKSCFLRETKLKVREIADHAEADRMAICTVRRQVACLISNIKDLLMFSLAPDIYIKTLLIILILFQVRKEIIRDFWK